jgi:hypothetical protein
MNTLTINEQEFTIPKKLISFTKSQLIVYQVLIQFYLTQFGKNAQKQIFLNDVKVKFDTFFSNILNIFQVINLILGFFCILKKNYS